MREISVFSCQKASDFDDIESYIKMSLPWARVQNINKFSTTISRTHLAVSKALHDKPEKRSMIQRDLLLQIGQKTQAVQTQDTKQAAFVAQKAYESVYVPYISGYNIALDVKGETLSSQELAKVLSNHSRINIFIGGAYGFSNEFKGQMQKLISLSSLTMAHKIAKLVLFEQIYRALSINANHPYHK